MLLIWLAEGKIRRPGFEKYVGQPEIFRRFQSGESEYFLRPGGRAIVAPERSSNGSQAVMPLGRERELQGAS